MRRAALCLLTLLILATPAISRADSMNESQKPNEYTQEDSQPLKFASYFVAPIGFVLEWTVTRPMHWVSTNTFLAPVLDSEYGYETTPAPIAELPPPDYLPLHDPVAKPAPLHEENVTPHPPRSPGAATTESQPFALPLPPAETGGQPMLH